jgi:hypothetical protein
MEITKLLYFSILLIGVFAGTILFRKNEKPGRFLLLLFVYVFLKEFLAAYLAVKFRNNLSYYQLLGPVDACLIILIIGSFPIMKNLRKFLVLNALLIFVFYFVNLIFLQPPGTGADTNFKVFRSFFMVLLSLIIFIRLNNTVGDIPLFKRTAFWVGAGMLIFYTFNIFYWGFFNYLLVHKNFVLDQVLRPMFISVNYIMYLTFIVAIFSNEK